MSEDQVSDGAGRMADLSVVTRRKHRRGQFEKKDEQPTVVVNSNGVRNYDVIYAV